MYVYQSYVIYRDSKPYIGETNLQTECNNITQLFT